MQAARALLKLYNSAEQSVNLPARGVASRGGSLFFICNKAVGRSRWLWMYTNSTLHALFKRLQAPLSNITIFVSAATQRLQYLEAGFAACFFF